MNEITVKILQQRFFYFIIIKIIIFLMYSHEIDKKI